MRQAERELLDRLRNWSPRSSPYLNPMEMANEGYGWEDITVRFPSINERAAKALIRTAHRMAAR